MTARANARFTAVLGTCSKSFSKVFVKFTTRDPLLATVQRFEQTRPRTEPRTRTKPKSARGEEMYKSDRRIDLSKEFCYNTKNWLSIASTSSSTCSSVGSGAPVQSAMISSSGKSANCSGAGAGGNECQSPRSGCGAGSGDGDNARISSRSDWNGSTGTGSIGIGTSCGVGMGAGTSGRAGACTGASGGAGTGTSCH